MRTFKYTLACLAITAGVVLAGCSDTTTSSTRDTDTTAAAQTTVTTAGATEADTDTTVSEADSGSPSGGIVTITDAHGNVEVPVRPERVVSLDNRTFQTLDEWGIELVAAPKAVMPSTVSYVTDDDVVDIGNHREPNLELIAAADPDLVIVGQRFATFYEDIKALVPNAAVIDVNIDVSETADNTGDALINGFKDQTRMMGEIFAESDKAEALITELDDAIAAAKAQYVSEETVIGVIISGGSIGYSAPGAGRVWGPLYSILGWTPGLEVDGTTTDHEGDEISVEAIAQSNPDWLMVLDRDAGTSDGADAEPAGDVLEGSEALAQTIAVVEDQIVYAPNDTYTNESIQTFTRIFESIAEAFEAAAN